MKSTNEDNRSIYTSVFFIALVLLLHVALIAGLILSVVLFKGIYDLRWWILAAGLVLIAGSGYFFYRRVKAGKRRLRDIMNDPAFKNSSLEISLMGGMATLRIAHQDNQPRLVEIPHEETVKQLPHSSSPQLSELAELNRMLEQGLITKEEFLRLKQDIL